MLLVKTHVGDGAWKIFEADRDVEWLGSHAMIEIPAHDDHDFWEDERFPTDDTGTLHMPECHVLEVRSRFVHWAKWFDAKGVGHILITSDPIFICNDRGDTIEAIR